MVVAGAPPPSKTIERVETELGWQFHQIYGLTETSPVLTINSPRFETDHLTPAERSVVLSAAGAPTIGTVIATLHDVFVTLAVFSFFRGIVPFPLEIDQYFIAAILTVIGFSMNDTVIVYDRIREDSSLMKLLLIF